MANSERLHVFEDENGVRYTKQFTPEQLKEWKQSHPNHTQIK
jgi:hypothetical protein